MALSFNGVRITSGFGIGFDAQLLKLKQYYRQRMTNMVPKVCFTLENERLLQDDWQQLIETKALYHNMIVKKDQHEIVISSKSERPLLYNSFAPVAVMKKLEYDSQSKIQVTLSLSKSTSIVMAVFYALAVLMTGAMVVTCLTGKSPWSWLYLLPIGLIPASYLLAWSCFYISAKRMKAQLMPT